MSVTNAAAFRYVRFLSPDSGFGNVAELEFHGYPLRPDQLPNSPQMGVALTGTNLTVSWPLANAGFTVQSRTNLVLGDWMDVTSPGPANVSNLWWQLALPPATNAGSVFYRLIK